MLFSARAAVPHLKPGSSIIVTSSIQAFNPSPGLIDYAMTKAAQVAFVKALAQQLRREGDPCQRRRAWPDLDTPHSRYRVGCREGGEVRTGHAARSSRSARRARGCLRLPGIRSRILRLRSGASGDRRQRPLTREVRLGVEPPPSPLHPWLPVGHSARAERVQVAVHRFGAPESDSSYAYPNIGGKATMTIAAQPR